MVSGLRWLGCVGEGAVLRWRFSLEVVFRSRSGRALRLGAQFWPVQWQLSPLQRPCCQLMPPIAQGHGRLTVDGRSTYS